MRRGGSLSPGNVPLPQEPEVLQTQSGEQSRGQGSGFRGQGSQGSEFSGFRVLSAQGSQGSGFSGFVCVGSLRVLKCTRLRSRAGTARARC